MTNEAFTALLEHRIGQMRAVLARKAEEYASQQDRLHNFKAAAAMSRQTAAQACFGMLAKHLVSVVDLVEADAGGVKATPAILEEKIGDSVNYLVLLHALLAEVGT